MKTFRKWDGWILGTETFTDTEAGKFYVALKNYLKRCFPNAEITGFKHNWFSTSGFVTIDDVCIYVSHNINRATNRIDFDADGCFDGVLIRTAKDTKDFRGGTNHFCSLNTLQISIIDLVMKVKKVKRDVM